VPDPVAVPDPIDAAHPEPTDSGHDEAPALGDVDADGYDDSLEALHWYGGGGLGVGFTTDADVHDSPDVPH
jgi:hypothetical protein